MRKLQRIPAAILIGILAFLLLLITVKDIGLTWDEPAYIASSNSYMEWYREAFTNPRQAFTPSEITKYWSINHEHPPVDKVWTGLWWTLTRGLTDDLAAHRIGNMLLAALMVALLYHWVSQSFGGVAGLAAAAALLTMPRFFFHSHLSSLDVPAAFAVFLVTWLFWKLQDQRKWGWGILLGVVWGFAIATKVNAMFIPFTLGLWWLIFKRNRVLFIQLLLMGLTGIPVFMLAWPWLFTSTISRLVEYIGFVTVSHWQIGQYYLGKFYMPPPWHFGFVMLWAVVPLGLTIMYLTGLLTSQKTKENRALVWLLFLSALTPVVAIAISKSLVYDNDRMYMAAFPFLAALAGIGFGWLYARVKELAVRRNWKTLQWLGTALLTVLFFAPQLVSMVRLYPHYLSYYGEGVGGVAGASKLGLETTYWCETYALALPILNDQAQPNDKVWADPWSHDVLIYYQTQGLLRDDLIIVAPENVASILGPTAPSGVQLSMGSADWFIFEHRQTTLGAWLEKSPIARALKAQETVYEYSFNGVPIMTLYKTP